jgi:hypothetical protein
MRAVGRVAVMVGHLAFVRVVWLVDLTVGALVARLVAKTVEQ